jgi:protein-disulfide isomerase
MNKLLSISVAALIGFSNCVFSQEAIEPSEEFSAKFSELFAHANSIHYYNMPHDMVAIGVITKSLKQQVYYTNKDGDYVLSGMFYDVDKKQTMNAMISAQLDEHMPPPPESLTEGVKQLPSIQDGEGDQVVYAIVDPQCGFCKRLHQTVDRYRKLGKLENVEVRYIMVNSMGPKSTQLSNAIMSKENNEEKMAALASALQRQPIALDANEDGKKAVSVNKAFMDQFDFISGVPYIITEMNGKWITNPGLPGDDFFNNLDRISQVVRVESSNEPRG